ncbi:MAG TPA: hypothetical protein V6C58_14830, partial [Allocoleopsis sp.]
MKSILSIFFHYFIGCNTLVSAQQTPVPTAKEIIEKNIEAQGGRKILENIKTMYSESYTVMDGREVLFVTKEMAPNKGIFEIIYQG